LPEPPEPKRPSGDISIGSYYITGWGTFKGRSSDWSIGTKYYPILGFYKSDDPSIADWHIYWMVQNGRDHAIILSTNPGRGAISGWENNFEKGFLNAKLLDKKYINFSMMFNSEPFWKRGVEALHELTQHTISYFARNYFPRPEYKKVENKPVVFIYKIVGIEANFGIDEVSRLTEVIRDVANKEGYDIYLVGDVMTDYIGESENAQKHAEKIITPFDAISAYNIINAGVGWKFDEKGNVYIVAPYSSMVDGYINLCRWWSNQAKKYRRGFIPPITPEFDNSILYKPLNPNGTDDWLVQRTNPTLEEYKRMCKGIRPYIDPHLNMVIEEAFNEYQEGSVTEPTLEFGFSRLNMVRDLFFSQPEGGWSPNLIPSYL
jgi:hypothetical protein